MPVPEQLGLTHRYACVHSLAACIREIQQISSYTCPDLSSYLTLVSGAYGTQLQHSPTGECTCAASPATNARPLRKAEATLWCRR